MQAKISKLFLSVLLSFGLIAGAITGVSAADKTVDELVGELIYYYKEGDAETDVLRTLDAIKAISETDYKQWKSIIDYWKYVDNDMTEYIDEAPDGLPTDSTHAFVVLGYQLNADGSMTDELKGRCQVAYNCAMKYPNSYVVVAGGGTAKNNPSVTEADSMKDYLVNTLGLDESRIIVENQSKTTVQNAENTFTILYKNYDISTITMVSSQYHLKRASLLYYAESLIKARELGVTPISIVAAVGWVRSDKSTEGVAMEASSLAQIAGVSIPGVSRPGETATAAPDKSTLVSLRATGTTSYQVGQSLDLTVTATYSIDDYQREITSLATITGYDANTSGTQTVTISYTENNVTQVTTLEVTVVEAKATVEASESSTADTSESSAATKTTAKKKAPKTGDTSSYLGYLITGLVSISGLIFGYQKRFE